MQKLNTDAVSGTAEPIMSTFPQLVIAGEIKTTHLYNRVMRDIIDTTQISLIQAEHDIWYSSTYRITMYILVLVYIKIKVFHS